MFAGGQSVRSRGTVSRGRQDHQKQETVPKSGPDRSQTAGNDEQSRHRQ